jgi:hypothetical protein
VLAELIYSPQVNDVYLSVALWEALGLTLEQGQEPVQWSIVAS